MPSLKLLDSIKELKLDQPTLPTSLSKELKLNKVKASAVMSSHKNSSEMENNLIKITSQIEPNITEGDKLETMQSNTGAYDQDLIKANVNELTSSLVPAYDGTIKQAKSNISFRIDQALKNRLDNYARSIEFDGAIFSINQYLIAMVKNDLNKKGF
jgi:hypothetical protein